MKKLAAIIAIFATTVLAVGPKFPCMLTWSDSTTPDVTGYWFYWRATNSASYTDTQRIALTSTQRPFDLRILGLPKGIYLVMMTATNTYGESDPSDEFVWHYTNPNKPTDIQINAP